MRILIEKLMNCVYRQKNTPNDANDYRFLPFGGSNGVMISFLFILQDNLVFCGPFILIVLYYLCRYLGNLSNKQVIKGPILLLMMNKVQISLHNELHLTLQKKL